MRPATLSLLAAVILAPATRADDYALCDGDTVAFLGDSITAARVYGKIIENYTLLRFPDRKVKFINVGIGGDTAAGGRKRLERDVFANKVTVLTVAYGSTTSAGASRPMRSTSSFTSIRSAASSRRARRTASAFSSARPP